MVYAFIFKIDGQIFVNAVGIYLPQIHTPTWEDILTGFFILGIPQVPLSSVTPFWPLTKLLMTGTRNGISPF
ncbi:MAG: hypothetical protein Ct9H300mP2_4020 [Candidatus Neomarinimicrobiota bacterium]|nr:MAG: hypothetical protein Ct9H300mP2_4020 [Candidatus Neomarinimicrobiota bacterium]